MVGTTPPKGLPLPVVNSIRFAPPAARLVTEMASLPLPVIRDRPGFSMRSPYHSTSTTGALPPFWMLPMLLSSSVDMPLRMLPGAGLRSMGWP